MIFRLFLFLPICNPSYVYTVLVVLVDRLSVACFDSRGTVFVETVERPGDETRRVAEAGIDLYYHYIDCRIFH